MDNRKIASFWDENAPDWIEAVRAGWDVYREFVNNPAFFELLGDIAGMRVLDVGCGEGYNTRKFADLGAKVAGVDVSRLMIASARDHEADEPRGIEYHQTPASDLGVLDNESFDAVLSTMTLMDLGDYTESIAEIARVLKPGGLLQFSVSHPCTMTRMWRWVYDDQDDQTGVVVGDYFSLDPTGRGGDVDEWYFGGAPRDVRKTARSFRIPRFFRTLSEYFNTLTDAGFRVEKLAEPNASEDAVAKCPNVADTRIIPYFLIFRCRKTESPQP
ncbi:MAG: class I SAM-dependent methyltransferase [Phycisphaerae bacterium]|jgi:SAM-dependent methyltransferase|nr:class I SAM-dependent methyltransferase [Phycisphaerae bacterium]